MTPTAPRPPLLLLGAAALVTGLWAGLTRIGAAPAGPASPLDHGALMVSGFLGTVISLERAVAARTGWALAGPALCGAGTVAILTGHAGAGAVLLTGGSLVIVAVLLRVLTFDRELHHLVLTVAAVGLVVGNALLVAGRPVFDAVGFWLVFLVGTIAAERLELNRLIPRTRVTVASFLVASGLLAGGALVALLERDLGFRLLGAGALGLSAWMLRYDLARRTVRKDGSVRFIAVALLGGYGWLGVGGVLGLGYGHPLAGPHYDALLHAIFVGFVFSMIFGHALVIIPALLAVKVPYTPRFYVHLALLHLALVARVAGDLGGSLTLRQAGSWLNVAAIALFLVSTVVAGFAGSSRPAARPLVPAPK
ncbi:MAG: hypothetical protein ACOZQL_24010 [Myxococcota bacterium]